MLMAEADARAQLHALPEPVRLVVWDLDETFWRGTLSEGGIAYDERADAIVVALANRGIISSICSKNDPAAVAQAFAGRAAWEYFVMPQIDWQAKGPKLATLVERMQLRPASVLFIDDNHLMRAEAAHCVPGINTADETVVPHLLAHPRLQGKDDAGLSRLAHYRLLERRQADAAATAGQGVASFLRASDITVTIDHDIAGNLDRAIELINRTNQLNFTKQRLSEDLPAARTVLLELIGRYDVQSGLVRVRDRYGDYGHVGLYIWQRSVHPGSGLLQFCFSCRILGMGVETWLYRRLGRPPIAIMGEVLTDLHDDGATIDWIGTAEPDADGASAQDAAPAARSTEMFFRGGCELLAIEHYCRHVATATFGEFAFHRDGIQLRLEHSIMAAHAAEPPPAEALASFERLGFMAEDFRSRMIAASAPDAVWVLSFWADPVYRLYRHRATGALIPFNAFPVLHPFQDLTQVGPDAVAPEYRDHWIVGALAHLAEAYEPAGLTDEALFKRSLRAVLARLPSRGRAVLIGSNEWFPPTADGTRFPRGDHVAVNRWTREAIADEPRAHFLDAADYLHGDADVDPIHADHYARGVYHRLFKMIAARL